jgi:Cu/Ag efflux pump CusA
MAHACQPRTSWEGASWQLDTAIRGAADRLTPLLMTSIVTGLGVLPLAVGMGDPGREVERPMAVVILGGLLGLYQLGVRANNFAAV